MTLQAALRAVLPHAPLRRRDPSLSKVRIAPGLTCATDRHTIGTSTWEWAGDPFDDFSLDLPDAKRVAALDSRIVSIAFDGPHGTLTSAAGLAVTVPIDRAGYPDVQRLIPDGTASLDGGRLAWNPEHLARFGHRHLARDRHEKTLPLHLSFYLGGTTQRSVPVARIEFAGHFVGAAATVAMDDREASPRV